MNNYQLLSTNIMLGGQMKWNLQIKGFKDELCVDDFFLSPISKWIPYDKPDRPYLNYSHDENIKDLYNTIKGDFFETKLDPRLTIKTPIIVDKEDNLSTIDTYCDMYDMGVSRISKSQMGKSLQVFCPLWLEDFNEESKIKFKISIYTPNKENEEYKDLNIEKELKLEIKNNHEYHDKFVRYFNDYIKTITETVNEKNVIGDKLINIDFNNSYMSIEGINVENGKKTNKNISYSLPNLVSRFRPMMDTDNLIISNFPDNNLICKQLFNFNLIFDIEDILSHSIFTQLVGQELYFEVKCYIDEIEIPIKSFSYDYSKDFDIKDSNPDAKSLDFFEDYNAIQLIDKNKICPQILHWSSVYDNDYIFNIYPDAMWNTNLWGTNVGDDNLCLHWCNNDLMFNVDTTYNNVKNYDLLSLISTETKLSNYSTFKTGKTFVNNVFYDNNDKFEAKKIYINIVKDLIEKSRINNDKIKLLKIEVNGSIWGYIYNRGGSFYNIIIDEAQVNNFSFKNMKDHTSQYISDFDGFSFKEFLNNAEDSKIISISNSISINKADCPTSYDNKTTEIDYGRIIIPHQYMFRTDGHIKPTFINESERKHYMIKKITKTEYNESWDKLVRTKFPALYPSINYFYIHKTNTNDYKFETRWFNESKIFVLMDDIHFSLIKNVKIDKFPIKENLINLLKSYYNIYEEDKINYIFEKYNIDMYFDYLNPDKLDEYKYIIKMTLK